MAAKQRENGKPDIPRSFRPDDRLDTWKRIAAYLNRSVRTVQRWEKREGLPVHRHMHEERGTPYAYRAELDAWWANRRPMLESAESGLRGRRLLAGGAAAGAVLLLLTGALVAWQHSREQALPFEERDWVLIAAFENRTGEEVFEGTLEHALAYELVDSRFVNVVPGVRVDDTLQLMQEPLDAPLTPELAHEVALRDGGIRAVLTGRVEKLDSTYLLSVGVVDPADGAVVAAFREEAAGEAQVPAGLRRLSSHVRRGLGESLADIRLSEQQLERVTTPSLRALRLFTRADEIIRQPVPVGTREEVLRRSRAQNEQAEELLRQAVAEDPEFASAWMHLAWAISNQGRPEEDYRPYAKRAVALSDRVSERERRFILGSYFNQTGELPQAVTQYETLLRLYPDHYWGNNNLVAAYYQLGRPDDALVYVRRRAELRPNDYALNCQAAQSVARLTGNPEEARPYLARARQLATPDLVQQYAHCAAFLEIFPALEHLLAGRVEEALAEASRLHDALAARPEAELRAFRMPTAGLHANLGKLEVAAGLYALEPDGAIRHWNLAKIALERGDDEAFGFHVREMSRYPEGTWWAGAALLYVRAGLLAEAEQWLRDLPEPDFPGHEIVRGELARARGQEREGLRLLKAGYDSVRHRRDSVFYDAAESLALALAEAGDHEGAVEILEYVGRQRGPAVMGGATLRWNALRHHQARLYRELGREPEAQQIEDELRRLLAYADEDHALRRALESAALAAAMRSR